jgi:hypothetical protein
MAIDKCYIDSMGTFLVVVRIDGQSLLLDDGKDETQPRISIRTWVLVVIPVHESEQDKY